MVVVGTDGFHWFLLQPAQGSVERLEGHRHPIQGVQSIQDACHMQIPILIDHLGIVPGHSLQGRKHRFFDLSSIVASLQDILNLATPISIGNGILFSGFSEQWETKVLILRLSNSQRAWVCSLRMVRFLRWCLSAEGARARCPEASVSSPVLALSSASNALVTPPSSSSTSSRAESNCSHSGLCGWVPNKAGRCAKVGSSKFISLSCCCTKNLSAHLVVPRPRGDLWGVVGWAFKTGAIAKAFK